jgi:nitrite reductase/ring-hydroxylating ferredoxin subunit
MARNTTKSMPIVTTSLSSHDYGKQPFSWNKQHSSKKCGNHVFNKYLIPNAHNLPEGQALNITVEQSNFLITKQQGQIIAFENICPHQNKPLNWSSESVLDDESDYLQCHHHGALFSPSDGVCITGPCQGSQLKKATVGIEQGHCYLLFA